MVFWSLLHAAVLSPLPAQAAADSTSAVVRANAPAILMGVLVIDPLLVFPLTMVCPDRRPGLAIRHERCPCGSREFLVLMGQESASAAQADRYRNGPAAHG